MNEEHSIRGEMKDHLEAARKAAEKSDREAYAKLSLFLTEFRQKVRRAQLEDARHLQKYIVDEAKKQSSDSSLYLYSQQVIAETWLELVQLYLKNMQQMNDAEKRRYLPPLLMDMHFARMGQFAVELNEVPDCSEWIQAFSKRFEAAMRQLSAISPELED